MNYRHAYHASNHADVFKHLVLTWTFALLRRKDTPCVYLGNRSGVGLYDLQGDKASHTGEWEQDIARPWECEGLLEQLNDYLDVIRHLSPDDPLRYHPGPPEPTRHLTRAQDRVLLNELHPEDSRLLKANMAGERRIAVHQGDGWLLPRAFLPAPEKCTVLLIDPPFEQANELQRCIVAFNGAIRRVRQTVVMIWYPIKDERQLKRFYQALERSIVPKLLRTELHVHPIDNIERFNDSGLAIVNPPWPLEDGLRGLLPWLAEVITQSQGGWRLDWLVAEQSSGRQAYPSAA